MEPTPGPQPRPRRAGRSSRAAHRPGAQADAPVARGDQVKVDDYLDTRGLQRNALFNQILQALIELAEAGSDERSILEALSNHGSLPRRRPRPAPANVRPGGRGMTAVGAPK